MPRLFAPNPFQQGSSVAHLDDATYPPGSLNSLMTPRLSRGETNYNPGPVALGMMADMGWAIASAPPPSTQPSPSPSSPPTGSRCFQETNQCISGRFLAYWDAHGSLPINGFPLTGERLETLEDGKQYTVQWFERVRMEYHPENAAPNDVLLGQFGRRIHPADPPVAQKPAHSFFPQTGHNMPLDFFDFWDRNGGVSQFGFPLTEEFTEQLEDGKSYTVQYTERARFERHPENGLTNPILLGQFGRRLLNGGGPSPAPTPAPSSSPVPSTSPAPQPGAQITITPRQGPNETLFVVTGVGFTKNATYYLRIASHDGSRQITFDDPSMASDEDGVVLAGFSFGGSVPAGGYVANAATALTGGSVVASVPFNLTGAGAPQAGPALSVTPSQARGRSPHPHRHRLRPEHRLRPARAVGGPQDDDQLQQQRSPIRWRRRHPQRLQPRQLSPDRRLHRRSAQQRHQSHSPGRGHLHPPRRDSANERHIRRRTRRTAGATRRGCRRPAVGAVEGKDHSPVTIESFSHKHRG